MQDHDWIFDLTMDLCDKADHMGLKEMSAKLEEALDAFLTDMGHAAESTEASNARVAAFGPISLGPDSFALGTRRVIQKPTAPRAIHFASRRTLPSAALQALQAARAKSAADEAGEEEPMELLDRAS